MLSSPSLEGQFTPPSTIVSKDGGATSDPEKHIQEPEIVAPKPISAAEATVTPIEQKIPFLVPSADDEGKDVSGRTTPEPNVNGQPKPDESEMKAAQEVKGEKEKEIDAAEGLQRSTTSAGSKGKGKAKEVASEGPLDEVDELLKQWTTVLEE
jgi:hypothetical protein